MHIRRSTSALAVIGLTTALSGTLTTLAAPAHADTAPGAKMLLVLDASGSMSEQAGDGHTKIDDARTALTRLVQSLPDRAAVGMRVFGATKKGKDSKATCTDSQLAVPVRAGNKSALTAAIGKYAPYGQTPTAYALKQAGKDLGSTGQRSIVLVSDGEATCNSDPCAVAKQLRAKGVNLRIDVIGLEVSGKAKSALQCVAASGGGRYYDAADAGELDTALSTARTRAFKPFGVNGKPVEGTSAPADAPVIGDGEWTDKGPAKDSVKFYRLHRTAPGSTLWAGVAMQPRDSNAAIDLTMAPPDSSGTCSSLTPMNFSVYGSVPPLLTGLATSAGESSDPGCATGNPVLSLKEASTSSGVAGRPMQLNVVEEPPVANASVLPPTAADPTWQPMPHTGKATAATGGANLDDAPLVRPGKHTLSLLPGETKLVKVHLGWGQRLQATATAGPDPSYGSGTNLLDIDVLSPLGGSANLQVAPGMPTEQGAVSDTEAASAAAITPEVRYNNRESSADWDLATARAGDFYVSVFLNKSPVEPPTVALPVTLDLAVLGTKGAGAPTYAGSAPASASSPRSSSEGGGSTRAAASAPHSPDDSTPWGLVGGLGGGIVVLAGIGTAAGMARHRRVA